MISSMQKAARRAASNRCFVDGRARVATPALAVLIDDGHGRSALQEWAVTVSRKSRSLRPRTVAGAWEPSPWVGAMWRDALPGTDGTIPRTLHGFMAGVTGRRRLRTTEFTPTESGPRSCSASRGPGRGGVRGGYWSQSIFAITVLLHAEGRPEGRPRLAYVDGSKSRS